jgi:hypothetical protein
MNAARDLIDDLAVIGATIEPAGDRLILRAGPNAISAELVNRVRESKADLLATLASCTDRAEIRGEENKRNSSKPPRYSAKDRTSESFIVEWLNQHPAPSAPGRCVWCGKPEFSSAMVLPFGTEPGTHAWLHAECWPAWHRGRKAEATAALVAMGVKLPVGLKNPISGLLQPPTSSPKAPTDQAGHRTDGTDEVDVVPMSPMGPMPDASAAGEAGTISCCRLPMEGPGGS